VAFFRKEAKMLNCCKFFMLCTTFVVASFMTLGCGGGDDSITVVPADAVAPTDNPDEEPSMEDGP